mgnify:FL=1|jgi:hypothetical protein|tara:strand:- start:13 stop:1098 length:1086 start_codon:yes stop_codon:yes gene_type:complete
MSFKDKPLKKIISDKRVTIDALHQGMSLDFTTKRKQYEECLEEKTKLQTSYAESPDEETKLRIVELDEKLKEYNPNDSVDYYLNTGGILNEYYSRKEETVENTEITVLDFMNKNKNINGKKEDNLVNNYMRIIDDTVIKENYIQDIHNCPLCLGKLILKNVDSLLICEECGYTDSIIINSEKVSYKDPPRESSYFAYKRINHFNEWLAQFQAKETTDIPEEVYKGILKELKKNNFLKLEDISYKNMREILKKLKYNKYYEHIPHIINIINGQKAPILTRQYEEQLRIMFKEIQTPFMVHCPENRKNFLSYSYVLHKFCELLELDHLLIYFPLLKSREKLQQQDIIWQKICNTLLWEYIPSI